VEVSCGHRGRKGSDDAIISSGYIFATIRLVYVFSGIAFLVDGFAPLGAVVLFPIRLNILLFHSVHHPPSIPQASVFFVLNCLVLYVNRGAYLPLFRSRHRRNERPPS
jgi:putative oxidoreductase